MRKPGAVAALAVLFGLLLNVAGATGAHPARDGRTSLGNGEIVRSAAGTRLATRAGNDDADRESVAAVLPPPPRIVTARLSIRPAATSHNATASARTSEPTLSYRARAPPAV